MPISDPHSRADLSQGRIQHVDLQVKVDFQARALRIRAHYNLQKPAAGILSLDGGGLNIGSVFSTAGPIEYETGAPDPILGERITINLREHTDDFTIELTTARDAKALQWLEPKKTAGGMQPFLYSQCAPIHARSIFPCQDTPSVRFTYDAQLEVPKGLKAVMAAQHVGTLSRGDTAIYSFRMPQPIPSYLFAFAVGDLQFRELGPRTGIYAEPHVLDEAAWEFEDTEQRLAAAEALYGPYLWDRYDLLVMPPSFPYGGMENPRLTFLSPLAVRGDRSRTSLVSHELAHSWLGNLVTNATWEDFWLNEGWTTYAQGRISELVDGPEFAALESLLNQDELREDLAAFGPDSALTRLKTSLKGVDPDEAFSMVPYAKGELLILSLERAVGRDAFDTFMRAYSSDHQFRSLTTEEFLGYVQQMLPAAAELVNIREWLYGTGLPSSLPEVRSILYDRVKESIAAYHGGALPRPEEVSGWHPHQMSLFVRLLPERIPSEHCQYLGDLFQLAGSRNKNLLFLYCRLCIHSEYRAILPEVESFVAEVGNLYMLTRLFRSLAAAQWTRDMARPMFERARDRYHPITAAVVDKILTDAAL